MSTKEAPLIHISREEWANVVTHGLGLVLCLIGVPWLLHELGGNADWYQWSGLLIYGLSLIAVYASSTIYHSLKAYPWSRVLLKIDHIAIYFLIAGTHTPFLLYGMANSWGWFYLAVIWGLVLVGIFYKLFFLGRWPWLSVSLYLIMGWLGAITLPQMWGQLDTPILVWVLIGGVSYTLGVVFFLWHKLPYHHAIWHLFVLGGSIGHFIAIAQLT